MEDTPITLDDLRAAGYPEVVVDAVDAVTRRPGETYMDMIRRATAHPLGRLVKLADNEHNSSEARLAVLDAENAAFLRRRHLAGEVASHAHFLSVTADYRREIDQLRAGVVR